MRAIEIESDVLRLVVLPELGAGVAELALRDPKGNWCPLWRKSPENPTYFNQLASYVLAPWSNRIPNGHFTFAGKPYQIAPNWPDETAIHGDANHRAWQILDRSPVSARLELVVKDLKAANWPWPTRTRVRYEVLGGVLTTDLEVTNLGEVPMPAGLGFHPFFNRKLWDARDRFELRAKNTGRYPAEGMIPTGPARMDAASSQLVRGGELGTLELDDVFAGFDGRAEMVWPASGVRARYECSPELSHLVIYAPLANPGDVSSGPGDIVCIEPVSMVNDGFNRMAKGDEMTGVRVLGPGETLAVRWAMSVERI